MLQNKTLKYLVVFEKVYVGVGFTCFIDFHNLRIARCPKHMFFGTQASLNPGMKTNTQVNTV